MKSSFLWSLIVCLTLVSIQTTAFGQLINTPDEATVGLFLAWQYKDRKAAMEVVNYDDKDGVVAELFRAKRRKMVFKGCRKNECVFYNAKKRITLTMKTNPFSMRNGYRVYSIKFSENQSELFGL